MATVFVWETKNWSIRYGYVYAKENAEKIEKILSEALSGARIYWYRKFVVELAGTGMVWENIEHLSEDVVP